MDKKFLEEFLETSAKEPYPPPPTLEELIKEIDEVIGDLKETKLDVAVWQARLKEQKHIANHLLILLDKAEASDDEKLIQTEVNRSAAALQKVIDMKSRLNPLIEKKAELETLLGYLTADLINRMSK
jgi:hypothetical protein